MASIHMIFIENVKKIIENSNMTNAELAKRVGVSAPAMTEYLKGRRKPGIDLIESFATALGTTPAKLISPNGDIDADPVVYDPPERRLEDALNLSTERIVDMYEFLAVFMERYTTIDEAVEDYAYRVAREVREEC